MSTFLIDEAPFFLNDAAATASGSITVPGFTELNSGTASKFVLSAAPYPGALLGIIQTATATSGKAVVTNATGVTINTQGDRTMTFNAEGDFIILMGVSTTRWQIIAQSGMAFS